MADTSNENSTEASVGPSVPPPSPEVMVRTMRSDIESLAKSGGGQPLPQTVKAPLLASAADENRRKEDEFRSEKSKTSWAAVLITLVSLIIVAAVAYLAYNFFFAGVPAMPTGRQAVPATVPLQNNNGQVPGQTAARPGVGFSHATAFSKPVDRTLVLAFGSSAQNASELQTFSQRFLGIFSGTNTTSSFFEVNVKNADGSAADINGIFAAADAAVLAPDYVLAHFGPDATVFAYRDANGIWPGYILKLKPTENWLFLKDDVARIEVATAQIENFFLLSPGNPSAAGFADDAVENSPVRTLAFSQPGATFIYGWFRGYLIMSTSLDGLKQAMTRL